VTVDAVVLVVVLEGSVVGVVMVVGGDGVLVTVVDELKLVELCVVPLVLGTAAVEVVPIASKVVVCVVLPVVVPVVDGTVSDTVGGGVACVVPLVLGAAVEVVPSASKVVVCVVLPVVVPVVDGTASDVGGG